MAYRDLPGRGRLVCHAGERIGGNHRRLHRGGNRAGGVLAVQAVCQNPQRNGVIILIATLIKNMHRNFQVLNLCEFLIRVELKRGQNETWRYFLVARSGPCRCIATGVSADQFLAAIQRAEIGRAHV